MQFSKTTGCFYPEEIHYESLPADLIEVTQDDYNAAMNHLPGETLDVVKGKLIIVPAPVVSVAERLAKAASASLLTIDQLHAETVQRLVGHPTQVEQHTWALKLEVANAITHKAPVSAAGQAFLASAGIATDAAKSAWAASVLAKSSAYAHAVGLAERLRDTARTAVKAATDEASLKAVLDAQRAAADAAVDSLLNGI
ncbi:MAG: hypothetical protein LWW92_12135 [Rhodocyclales bacterium]|nr:hypothetical protein [Rhodocyclales bacterium]